MTEAEKQERDVLVDELVAKAGLAAGQIKVNQDPAKVARLIELGWIPKEKGTTVEARLKKIEEILNDHEKRISTCSVRR